MTKTTTPKRLALGKNQDGRLELFFLTDTGTLMHNFQLQPGSVWKGDLTLKQQGKQVEVGHNADGRLEVFWIGADDELRHDWQTRPNGDWYSAEEGKPVESLGAKAQALAVGENADGRLEVFYVAQNSELWHTWQTQPNGDWSAKEKIAATAASLAVGKNADGRLEVFWLTADGALWHDWQDAPNGDWYGAEKGHGAEKLHDAGATQVVVGNNADGRLEVFWLAADGSVWHDWQQAPNGDWTGKEQLTLRGVYLALAQNADGRIELFTIGQDGVIRNFWQAHPNGDWGGSESLGEKASALVAGRNADGRLEIFYFGEGGDVWHNWQPAPGMGPWESVVVYDQD